MKKNAEEVYIWFELFNGFIPPELQKDIINDLNSNSPHLAISEKDDNYFIRTQASFIDNKYYFSISTAGIQNLLYRIYLEVEEETIIVESEASTDLSEIKIIDQHKLSLINLGSTCWINKKKFILNRHLVGSLSPLHDHYILHY